MQKLNLTDKTQKPHYTVSLWMCQTKKRAGVTKQIKYGSKALNVLCCLLTFILCNYHSIPLSENDNTLGFKALRIAQHLRVLTFSVSSSVFECSGSPLKLAQTHMKPKQAWLENHWKGSYLVCISHMEIDSAHNPLYTEIFFLHLSYY